MNQSQIYRRYSSAHCGYPKPTAIRVIMHSINLITRNKSGIVSFKEPTTVALSSRGRVWLSKKLSPLAVATTKQSPSDALFDWAKIRRIRHKVPAAAHRYQLDHLFHCKHS